MKVLIFAACHKNWKLRVHYPKIKLLYQTQKEIDRTAEKIKITENMDNFYYTRGKFQVKTVTSTFVSQLAPRSPWNM